MTVRTRISRLLAIGAMAVLLLEVAMPFLLPAADAKLPSGADGRLLEYETYGAFYRDHQLCARLAAEQESDQKSKLTIRQIAHLRDLQLRPHEISLEATNVLTSYAGSDPTLKASLIARIPRLLAKPDPNIQTSAVIIARCFKVTSVSARLDALRNCIAGFQYPTEDERVLLGELNAFDGEIRR